MMNTKQMPNTGAWQVSAVVSNGHHEWQTDALAAATTANALIEGDDAAAASLSPKTRVGIRPTNRRCTRSPVNIGQAACAIKN